MYQYSYATYMEICHCMKFKMKIYANTRGKTQEFVNYCASLFLKQNSSVNSVEYSRSIQIGINLANFLSSFNK